MLPACPADHRRGIPAAAEIFGDRNPLWQLAPSADGDRAILRLWWALDAEGRETRHDFTDPALDTRLLGDLYKELSEHARKQFALLQTPTSSRRSSSTAPWTRRSRGSGSPRCG